MCEKNSIIHWVCQHKGPGAEIVADIFRNRRKTRVWKSLYKSLRAKIVV